jgi:hypothetical protein
MPWNVNTVLKKCRNKQETVYRIHILCTEGWFDKLKFCIMHGTYKLREKGIVLEQVLEIFAV